MDIWTYTTLVVKLLLRLKIDICNFRLVRFNKFLSEVPFRESLGMGGSTSIGDTSTGDYDKGLVQKMVLIILKCVALTTREARYV